MKPVCVEDIENIAERNLKKVTWDYYSCGSAEEQTLQDNRNAYKRYRLRPRVLVDVSDVDTSTTVLGSKLPFPVCISPTAFNAMAHPDGEVAVAKACFTAAASLSVGYTLSLLSTRSIEEVSCAAPDSTKFLQLFIFKLCDVAYCKPEHKFQTPILGVKDRIVTKQMIERAEKCGFKGLIITIDMPVTGQRTRNRRNEFALPTYLRFANFTDPTREREKNSTNAQFVKTIESLFDPSIQWSDIKWLKSMTKLPVVVKGILTSEMAEQAVQCDVDGILVSNHGARQLDGVPATIDALSEVVKAVDGRCEVYLDGGIRTGTDVLKAIALGARAVFIGRPAIWGLAYKGEEGVREVLNMLKSEFHTTMQLMALSGRKEECKLHIYSEPIYQRVNEGEMWQDPRGCRSLPEVQRGKNLVVKEAFYKSAL